MRLRFHAFRADAFGPSRRRLLPEHAVYSHLECDAPRQRASQDPWLPILAPAPNGSSSGGQNGSAVLLPESNADSRGVRKREVSKRYGDTSGRRSNRRASSNRDTKDEAEAWPPAAAPSRQGT